jgi:hypothetical protein
MAIKKKTAKKSSKRKKATHKKKSRFAPILGRPTPKDAARIALEYFSDIVTDRAKVEEIERGSYRRHPCWLVTIGYYEDRDTAYGRVLLSPDKQFRVVFLDDNGIVLGMKVRKLL